MHSKYIKKKEYHYKFKNPLNSSEDCKVSRASAELMLHRFCEGKEIDFPFHS